MRNFTKTFTCLLLFIVLLSCKSNKVALGQLAGSWLLANNNENRELEYRRIENEKDHFGSILNISKDSTLIDSYVMKCLSGEGQTKLYSEGTWSVNEKSLILTSTVLIDLLGNNFKIIQLDTDKFKLAKVELEK